MDDKSMLIDQYHAELALLRRTITEMEHTNHQLRQEIAQQKETIDELQQKETIWRTLLRNLPIDFWARDLNQRMLIESKVKAQIWGDMQSQTLDDITSLDEATLEHWRQNNRRGGRGNLSVFYHPFSGYSRWRLPHS